MNLARIEAMRIAKAKMALQPVYLDTETTGLDQRSEIIEVAVIDSDDRILFNSLVRPLNPIPPDASRIHGISNAMVMDQPTWLEIWPALRSVLAGRQIGIYNAEFDLRMIRQTSTIYRQPWSFSEGTQAFCIMKLYAQYRGERNFRSGGYRWHSLEQAGQHLGITLPNSHRALDDTRLAKAVFERLAADD